MALEPTRPGASKELNDLWRYSPGSGQWTWISGSNMVAAGGVYGTQGLAAASNVPGARVGSVSWIDSAGNLWLFGGSGYDSAAVLGSLNDLWRYNPGTGQWTWISGSNTVAPGGVYGVPGVYGTRGVAAAGNVPGARIGSVTWIDSTGNLWLFGGIGFDSAGTSGNLNDLWRYSPGTGEWTWVSGANTINAPGVYGTLGVAAAGNVPGARQAPASWTDSAGNLWLFGGYGNDVAGLSPNHLNDLWRYSLVSGNWTWVSGSNTAYALGVYGTQGVPDAANVPSSRYSSVSWIDSTGSLWLFGGWARDALGYVAYINDLWVY